MCAWKCLKSTHDRLALPSEAKPPFACHWPRGLSIWTVPAPWGSRVPKPQGYFITIGPFSSPSSSYACRLVLRDGSPPSLPPGLEDSGPGGWWGWGPEVVVPALAAAAAEVLAEAARWVWGLVPTPPRRRNVQTHGKHGPWGGGAREVACVGRGVPSVPAPRSWAPPEPLVPTPWGDAHLLPDAQETSAPFSLLWSLAPRRPAHPLRYCRGAFGSPCRSATPCCEPPTDCPQRDQRQCQPRALHPGNFSRTQSRSWARFHPWLSPFASPPPSLFQPPNFNFCEPSPRPLEDLTSSILIEFCLEQMVCES